MKEKMGAYIAVFNVREPELVEAERQYRDKFGKESFLEDIQPFIDKGIMSMFKVDPTEYTI